MSKPKDPVKVAGGYVGAAKRYGGDVAAAIHVMEMARVEVRIRRISLSLTPEERAYLITVLGKSVAA